MAGPRVETLRESRSECAGCDIVGGNRGGGGGGRGVVSCGGVGGAGVEGEGGMCDGGELSGGGGVWGSGEDDEDFGGVSETAGMVVRRAVEAKAKARAMG